MLRSVPALVFNTILAPDDPVIVPVLLRDAALIVVLVLPLAAVPLMVPLLTTVANGELNVRAPVDVRLTLAATVRVPDPMLVVTGPPSTWKLAVPDVALVRWIVRPVPPA